MTVWLIRPGLKFRDGIGLGHVADLRPPEMQDSVLCVLSLRLPLAISVPDE